MVLVSVLATSACGLLVDASGLTGGGADAGGGDEPEADGPGEGVDATLDGALGDASPEHVGDVGSADARDGAQSGRVQDDTTLFCGPTLACGRADPTLGCCVTFSDSGTPPSNYVYACLRKDPCVDAGGPASSIACDDGTDCPNPSNVCCWPSTLVPRTTYCFPADAGNCFTELCNPDAPVPCINHRGYACVPSGPPYIPLAPLGYHICVKDGG
jgi:hypothetical protein